MSQKLTESSVPARSGRPSAGAASRARCWPPISSWSVSDRSSPPVALARAIALDPTLIIYDEPFAGLDPISLNIIANLIRRLNDALGVTSVVVTYDLSESLKVVDYVYFIHDGVVMAEGKAAEMLESKDPFVRQFVCPDGPVAFRTEPATYEEELNIKALDLAVQPGYIRRWLSSTLQFFDCSQYSCSTRACRTKAAGPLH
jgi:hypothetical protein